MPETRDSIDENVTMRILSSLLIELLIIDTELFITN